jgi:MFS-type transporter involved in bile tolerance (Atg22 family)
MCLSGALRRICCGASCLVMWSMSTTASSTQATMCGNLLSLALISFIMPSHIHTVVVVAIRVQQIYRMTRQKSLTCRCGFLGCNSVWNWWQIPTFWTNNSIYLQVHSTLQGKISYLSRRENASSHHWLPAIRLNTQGTLIFQPAQLRK